MQDLDKSTNQMVNLCLYIHIKNSFSNFRLRPMGGLGLVKEEFSNDCVVPPALFDH